MKRILLVLSHPDDESFAVGGTIAKYVDAGWQVDLVCTTRGEAGNSGPYADLTKEELGKVRKRELEKAGSILGIHSITYLDYKDGELSTLIPGDIENALYTKIVEMIPDVVITMDTTGITNHPDHIRVCYATTFAFQKYAKWVSQQLADQKDVEDSLPKLYYACLPESVIIYLKKQKKITGESFGKPWVGAEDKFVTVTVDIADFADIKKEALRAHKSQEEDVNRYLSWSPIFQQEHFILRMHGTTEAFMGKNDLISSEL